MPEKTTTAMSINAAMGWMIMGHYNIATSHREGCCPFECGPCSALNWMRQNMSTYAEVAVRQTGQWEGYSWITPQGHIDWQPLLDAWVLGKDYCNCKGQGLDEEKQSTRHGVGGDGEDD